MKKVIILCILSTFIGTNLLSMLTTKFPKRVVIKNFKLKKFCDKKPFNYEEIILQQIAENLRLKEENHSLKQTLKQNLENCLTRDDIVELSLMQEQISFIGRDRRSNGGKLHDEE